jgi:hypothetical protein
MYRANGHNVTTPQIIRHLFIISHMTKTLFLSALLLFATITNAQPAKQTTWLKDWLSAWELVSNKILRLPADTIPDMLFFDENYIYTTSSISAPQGKRFSGPTLFGKKLPWRKASHTGKITLPDGAEVPVGLMSFAAMGKEKVFFVMGAPSFWQKAGVQSKELGLDKMLTGVFLHEFAHTRQINGFGKQVGSFEQNNKFEGELNDDIVQDYFKKDSVYEKLFRYETIKFYVAAAAKNKNAAKIALTEAFNLLKDRQRTYFINEKKFLTQLDDIFLSMEGVGQYVAVAWLIHPKGGKLSLDTAMQGFRRNGRQWSQEEGLATFLALTHITKINWAEDMFGPNPKTIVTLIENALTENR